MARLIFIISPLPPIKARDSTKLQRKMLKKYGRMPLATECEFLPLPRFVNPPPHSYGGDAEVVVLHFYGCRETCDVAPSS